nr:PREDICTED: estrogen sulfotransferase-like isoform X1 [Bemisia tabaci]XP_018909818.1 PREDICTED: estrogen sulfotransferase-like isoform X1 [Bemisia tabaci]XP_018909819.1 PREDICTED: estrogen sulfotransferase-like isoform X1 [Bemisia tabaci]XP_018909820.1 PREDICTED: estrogen sulfotransferase-like isoform X1 [Bemisia tabaci]XP_018909821.1 PREDICTED: estrogen sulfotransferase-like isoform X1 [Bemisia tabaci]
MPETLKYEKIESDTECGKVLNTLFVNKFRRGYVRVKGAVMPEDFKKFGDRIQQMDIRDDDVFVCSFPKAGTTWAQEMVWCIANNLDYKGAEVVLPERFPFLDYSIIYNHEVMYEEDPDFSAPDYVMQSVKYVNELNTRRFIKTHLPFRLLPEKLQNFSTQAKIIYMCRNPKDACVSYYRYYQLIGDYTGDFDTLCNSFRNDMLPYSPFWQHVLEYWAQRNNPCVLFLRYEEMKKDLPSVIRRTATFLGKSLSEEELPRLAQHLSFESMKGNRAVNYKPQIQINKKYNLSERDGTTMPSGSVGGWKKLMTPQTVKEFDAWSEAKVNGSGFKLVC